MAAQIVHAAGESTETEIEPGTNAVVLAARDEIELRQIAGRLAKAGVKHCLIQEIDPPWSGQCTAIGCMPTRDRKALRKILSSLPLLKDLCAGGVSKHGVASGKPDCSEGGP